MAKEFKHLLDAGQIKAFESDYLRQGRKDESWVIDTVLILGSTLSAKIRMDSVYVSSTDQHGFHLTIFSTLEFLSQLMIIYAHIWGSLKKKEQEGWMVDSHIRTVKAIRDPSSIHVLMTVGKIRRSGNTMLCVADFKIQDELGGLFEAKLKGFLS